MNLLILVFLELASLVPGFLGGLSGLKFQIFARLFFVENIKPIYIST